MAQYLLLVYSRPVAGQEAAYHQWYDGTHLADVIAVPGFKAAARYVPVPLPPATQTSGEYLAIYEIKTDDPAATMAALVEASSTMFLSPAIDLPSVRMELQKMITPRLERA
jgi:hypothetical protein